MDRLLLIDNDALLKLARYGLLNEAVALFGCTITDVRVLATAKYVLLPSKNPLLFCEDEESYSRLESFLKVAKPLDTSLADPEFLDAMSAVQNIDTGEALLLAVGATASSTLVITGDKRSLAALCSHGSVAHLANALAGRVVPMEVLFSYLVKDQFTYIQKCVRSKSDVDKALNIAFGVSVPATYKSVQEALASYINHLRAVTGNLLYRASS
ncbi:hypothetical protein IQ254_19270 [Nodosilinea sp. LEGE 07088]|uniref:hypothetical protein n=1 Tax=Nodosilinea sp. LEGE 07088 TaxID=2777968 RepID=UPI001882D3FC|nr:hypothetical protein [Nodosilinea sp. LEGE 07088]MBE9139312.1 hypothetical protein [Nodosilinea sp. LEGE 07088]